MTNNITIFSITLLLSTILYGQGNEILDYNNVSAQVSTTGIFFHDHGEGSGNYTAPKNQNASMFYSCSFWFAGLDPNGQLHMAAQRFQPNTAFFNGPVATNYSEADYISTYENKIWAVSKNEIQNHVDNYMQDGYIVPTAILEWPANGNTTNGEAEHLAPFIDYNNNNVYVYICVCVHVYVCVYVYVHVYVYIYLYVYVYVYVFVYGVRG